MLEVIESSACESQHDHTISRGVLVEVGVWDTSDVEIEGAGP